jgi:hypothetical protein
METILEHLLTMAGTALISLGIAWLKKKADVKAVINGKKEITDV